MISSIIENAIYEIELLKDKYVNPEYNKGISDCIEVLKKFELPESTYTLDDVKDVLIDMEYEDSVIFENPDFKDAIIGVDNEGSVVYDYELMVGSLMNEDNISYEEAAEFIDYNTLRTIPYITEGVSPKIIYSLPL